MNDDPRQERRKWIVATALTVATILIGVLQFSLTHAVAVRQPFLEMQTKQCVSASDNAARLASTRNMETWTKAREEFWALYWGPLAIVENVGSEGQGRVEQLMVSFGNDLRTIEAGTPSLPVTQLEQKALAISHACRDLLVSRWNAGIFRWISLWFGQ